MGWTKWGDEQNKNEISDESFVSDENKTKKKKNISTENNQSSQNQKMLSIRQVFLVENRNKEMKMSCILKDGTWKKN